MLVLLFLLYNNFYIILDWELFSLRGVVFVYRVLLDWISVVFLAVVFLISGRVIYYRHEYISHEKIKNSFCLIVFLFVMSIIFLIIRPSLVRVILGWDGLGLVSYLLVVYYQSYKSYGAGIITCLTNRIGDRALLVGMAWLLSLGNLDFVFYYRISRKELIVGAIFIVLAAITKRAQVPFSSWLPAAIAAPTPVSALVHSSTLVTAGVYLLIRFFPLFSSTFMNLILLSLGFITLLISSLRAFYEIDLKKVIALSTLRQLGVIIIALGLKLHILAFFHLLSHALFKASLFLRAGRIIHLHYGRQDVRHLRKVAYNMPLTISCLVICSFALGGIPFLSGFYSKDKIIEEGVINRRFIVGFIILFSIICTMIYSFRLLYYLAATSYSWPAYDIQDRSLITKRIIVLTFGGILGGRFIIWRIFSFSYDNLIFLLKLMIIVLFLGGGVIGLLIKFKVPSNFSLLLGALWVNPNFTAYFSSSNVITRSHIIFKFWDRGWRELIGPKGLANEINALGILSVKSTKIDFKVFLIFNLIIWILLFVFF